MSAEMFNVSLFEANPEKKQILTKDEVCQFCKHYNQHSLELESFLEQHDFEKWACVGIDIDAVYYAQQNDGRMDCSSPEFLGIMLTSLHDERYEAALMKYLKQFPVDGNLRFGLNDAIYEEGTYKVITPAKDFNRVADCPLWVVKVDAYAPYRLSGIVLIPTDFWNEDVLTYESAGYGYTIKERNWYNWDSAIPYRMNRVGAWSPNFLETQKSVLPTSGEPYQYDAEKDRFFKMPSYYGSNQAIEYYDLNNGGVLGKVEGLNPVGLYLKEDTYHIYTKKGLIKTNKSFEKLEKLDSKTGLMGNTVLQEYAAKGWSVILTNKGIDIQSPKAQKQDKLSAFKIKAGDANPRRLLIHAIDEHHLVLMNDKFMVVDADLNLMTHSLKKSLKKELTPWLGKDFMGVAYTNVGINIPNRAPFLFLNNLVISLNEKQEPIVMNKELYALTGEFNFYSAVLDEVLDGVWLLAGLERLVFLKHNLKEAFVFNTEGEGSVGAGKYPSPWLHLDKEGNLRYALNHKGNVRKIERKELVKKLKTATPYQS